MLLFSIPVHEKPDVVLNQIQNFKFYNPESIIILHVSAWMNKIDYRQLIKYVVSLKDVYINDKRIWSGYADGTQLKMHILNILYARKLCLNYKFICFHASNDMFVRSGLGAFISKMCGCSATDELTIDTVGYHTKACLNDKKLHEIMKRNSLFSIYKNQLEGSFYKRRIIDIVVDRILDVGMDEVPGLYSHGLKRWSTRLVYWTVKGIKKAISICKIIFVSFPGWDELGYEFYAKEESYFPTLSQDLIHRKGSVYCYVNWDADLLITKEDVDKIRNKKWGNNYYAVKRVDRKIDDPLRQYISNLPLQ
ncbi:MAG: hypothetical protein CMG74_10180 [Candidatus Marinimicrobia bacterium]|nr:hypothetical protein [Candidatus Neomarinimicrobiota bacterium]|tara:strand:+ start:3873 stop:4793 length:921 start_codon:yes stop_codon:yes gene_type:complete